MLCNLRLHNPFKILHNVKFCSNLKNNIQPNNMKKFFITSMMLGLVAAAFAAPLTPDQALERISQSGPQRLSSAVNEFSLAYTDKVDGIETAYLFNKNNGGFLILSADDLAYPILGYSDEGMIDPNNLPPQMEWWLSEYGKQIEYANANRLPVQPDGPIALVNPDWKAIPILCETSWNQTNPYNYMCPTIGSARCPTGCVATSMAQVMKFFNYPEKGSGNISYSLSGIGSLSLNLNSTPFEWDKMLNAYRTGSYDETQRDAVAYLMKACGYSVRMGYNLSASGAISQEIVNAMTKYFNYDKGLRFVSRDDFSTIDWIDMIYDNISKIGPVIYNGASYDGSGHSFIVDGYDGEGYFHINWGWGGLSNGYYAINALNPDALGTGGGSGGGYNFGQDILLGIQPNKDNPAPEIEPTLFMQGAACVNSCDNNVLHIGQHAYYRHAWMNITTEKLDVNMALEFRNVNGGDPIYATAKIYTMSKINLNSGTYMTYYIRDDNPNSNDVRDFYATIPSDLPDGTYKVTPMTRDSHHSTYPWYPVQTPYGLPNYVMLEKNGSEIVATTVEVPMPVVTDINLKNDLYFRHYVDSEVTMENNTDIELTYGLCLALLDEDGEVAYRSEPGLITVLPGEELTTQWHSNLVRMENAPTIREETEFTLAVYNATTLSVIGTFGNVTMKPDPGTAVFQMRSFNIPGAERVQERVNGRTQWVNMLLDPEDFNVAGLLKITSGYFDYKIKFEVNQLNPNDESESISLIPDLYSEQLYLFGGDEYEFDLPISLPYAEPGVIYTVVAQYSSDYTYRNISTMYFRIIDAGVEGEMIQDNIEPEYYNIQGMRIFNPEKGQLLIEKKGDKTRKIIF